MHELASAHCSLSPPIRQSNAMNNSKPARKTVKREFSFMALGV